jgi:hypothetical protein
VADLEAQVVSVIFYNWKWSLVQGVWVWGIVERRKTQKERGECIYVSLKKLSLVKGVSGVGIV